MQTVSGAYMTDVPRDGETCWEGSDKGCHNALGLDDTMPRKAHCKNSYSAGLSMTDGHDLKERSGANQAKSFLGRLDEVEGSMHKMLALLEQCLD